MFTRVSTALVALALIGFVAGCSESPTAKYETGKTAIENARLAEAELYAPDLFKEATDSLNAASVEMQKQDSRFSVFRKYGKSEEMIQAAQNLAEQAASKAIEEKEKIRLADSTLILEVENLINETKKIIATAPRGKGSRADLKVMQTDIDAASSMLTAASEEYQAAQYLSANEKLQAVKTQITKVKSDIEEAIAKLTKK
ncbi:MAG: hypothetical protein ACOYVF_13290 [Candidatus Zixiibacteriota bacterium]